MTGHLRHEGSSSGSGVGSGTHPSAGRMSRNGQQHMGNQHRNKSGTALSKTQRSGSRTNICPPTMTSLTPAVPPTRRGLPPPKKPVKFTMGADDEDEETESDEWSEDDKSGTVDRIVASPEDAPRIPGKSPLSKGDGGPDRRADGSQDGGDNDDEDEWSSDEPTEEELRREAQAKAVAERERRRNEEEKRQRELFQKVEVPIRSASAADFTQLGRFGMSSYSNNANQHPVGTMGPPLAPPTRSLLSSVFNSEEEYQIRAFHRARMMGGHAEAEQMRKAQIAAHASQPHLPQHAHEQARVHAQARIQAQEQPQARSGARTQSPAPSLTQARTQSRSGERQQRTPTDRDQPRRPSSIISNSGMDRGILRPSKSAVALPLLTQLELKSSTSQGSGTGASTSYLRRTPSDAGSGSVESGSVTLGEKGADPILRLESAVTDEQISESLSNRSLRKNGQIPNGNGAGQKAGTGSPANAPAQSGPAAAMLERSKSMDRRGSAGPMPAPSVASHRHSSTALNLLTDGNDYQSGYEVMLPAGAFAQTPRTTRRNMLRDELSESVRANLLWERQSRSRRMGSTSGPSGTAAPGYFANQPSGQASRPSSTGAIGRTGNGAGGGGGVPSAPAEGPPAPNRKAGVRPGQKNTVLSGDRLRPLTTSTSSSFTQSPTEQFPRRPGLGPVGVTTSRTSSDNGPGSGANSSDEELHADNAGRRHTYDYNNSFHHKGW
ncbi:unnamed protein product [Tilletia controversa]|uniref:DUF3295 domain-containing protein n=4 Tax=Tilletia TaxID=13289 RepID=A0A8X7MTV3_9BASI|nr:hypothetical protein CF336_g3767 [Tilletia laevis]KAE8198933.1 hypothetical protein CF328_g3398 [Tilletia controversa]KAE8248358.1 hypothetical protein A4X03_0g6802 [Tilletia caries]KAE8203599.1 hypothetical protein CF335_g2957 [Tilletia laevis]KAE8247702.1 hypothetical protein A4X06_0g4258 [Tilletia controversa]